MYHQYSYKDLRCTPKRRCGRMERRAWVFGLSRPKSWIAGSFAAIVFVVALPLQCAAGADPAGFVANVGT